MTNDFPKVAMPIRSLVCEMELEYDKFISDQKEIQQYFKKLPRWIRLAIISMTELDIYYTMEKLGIFNKSTYDEFILAAMNYFVGQGYRIVWSDITPATEIKDISIMIEPDKETLDMIQFVETHRLYKVLIQSR